MALVKRAKSRALYFACAINCKYRGPGPLLTSISLGRRVGVHSLRYDIGRKVRLKGGSIPLSPINFIAPHCTVAVGRTYGREAHADERRLAQATAAGSNPAPSSMARAGTLSN